MGLSSHALSNELVIRPEISASFLHADLKREFGQGTVNSISLTPSLAASYTSKRVNSGLNIAYENVDRDLSFDSQPENTDDSKGFTDYNASFSIEAIENVLSFNLGGKQSYQNTDPSNAFFSDRILGLDEVTKTNSHSYGANLNLSKGDYVGLVAQAGRTDANSDQTQDGTVRELASENASASLNLFSGKELRRVTWNLSSSYYDTNGTNVNDITSKRTSGSIYLGLTGNFKLVVTGSSEKNDFPNDEQLSRTLATDNLGAGLSWQGKNDRRIDITYNKSEKDGEEDKNFVGFDINWPFSTRTYFQANYGRRFFGESKAFSLTQKGRKFHFTARYDESVTSYSRLISSPTNLGSFVCPIGQSGFDDCFIPDTPDYELQPGEQLDDLIILLPEISEQVTLRKRAEATLGYDFRRLRARLTYGKADSEYLTIEREQEETYLSLQTNLRIGTKTSITWNNRYYEYDRSQNLSDDEIFSSDLTINHKFSSNLKGSLTVSYSDRDSNQASLIRRDEQVSLKVTYSFY